MRSTMPKLVDLARCGAACWSARTVIPSVTLPAHTSMLRGVDPTVHGIVDNDATETTCDTPSVLRHARAKGLRTAAVYAWTPMNATIESNATTERIVFDSGYDPADDEHVTLAALDILTNDRADLLFVYLVEGDLAGHDHGWMSDQYLRALSRLDAKLGRLIDALGPDDSVLVTTDHGGLGHDHGDGRPEDVETFIAAASPKLAAASWWQSASIIDVPATVAGLCGIAADDGWAGQTLLGREVPTIEIVMAMLRSMSDHRYGERVNMLDHSLQTAALARQSEASDDLIAAALLHDIGHVCDETVLVGDVRWGVPSHADIAGRFLQQILPSVSEPVRLHVDAKRFLVATDSAYASALSEASTITLEQQGGPFNADEAERFTAAIQADDAIRLRRWDDSGKVAGLVVDPLDHYRPLLTSLLERSSLSGSWCRDACTCDECRDPHNHQHLIDVADLAGWHVVDSSPGIVTVCHSDGRTHLCEIERSTDEGARSQARTWDAEHLGYIVERSVEGLDEPALAQLSDDLDQFGIALISGVPCEPGSVLTVAESIGFVRETNYGRLFDVITLPDPNNLAYTSLGLPLHTDNPYRRPCPSVQLLHCLRSANNGGASQFSDGFAAAERLRRDHPDAFDLLSRTTMRFRFQDEAVDLQAERPLIEVDTEQRVIAISVNHRSMQTPTPSAGIDRFYEAYQTFREYLTAPDAVVAITLRAGDLIAFDNRRVLHGRTGFSITEPRHLQGCYIDIDAVRSRARKQRGRSGAG